MHNPHLIHMMHESKHQDMVRTAKKHRLASQIAPKQRKQKNRKLGLITWNRVVQQVRLLLHRNRVPTKRVAIKQVPDC